MANMPTLEKRKSLQTHNINHSTKIQMFEARQRSSTTSVGGSGARTSIKKRSSLFHTFVKEMETLSSDMGGFPLTEMNAPDLYEGLFDWLDTDGGGTVCQLEIMQLCDVNFKVKIFCSERAGAVDPMQLLQVLGELAGGDSEISRHDFIAACQAAEESMQVETMGRVGSFAERSSMSGGTSVKAECKAQRATKMRIRTAEYMFGAIDRDRSGSITVEEIIKYITSTKDNTVKEFLHIKETGKADIVAEAGELFRKMDNDGNGELDRQEFIDGVVKMKEYAEEHAQMKLGALVIQLRFKSYLKAKRAKKVISIQKNVRGMQGRKLASQAAQDKRRQEAAQAEAEALREALERAERERAAAALKIQSMQRGKAQRAEFHGTGGQQEQLVAARDAKQAEELRKRDELARARLALMAAEEEEERRRAEEDREAMDLEVQLKALAEEKRAAKREAEAAAHADSQNAAATLIQARERGRQARAKELRVRAAIAEQQERQEERRAVSEQEIKSKEDATVQQAQELAHARPHADWSDMSLVGVGGGEEKAVVVEGEGVRKGTAGNRFTVWGSPTDPDDLLAVPKVETGQNQIELHAQSNRHRYVVDIPPSAGGRTAEQQLLSSKSPSGKAAFSGQWPGLDDSPTASSPNKPKRVPPPPPPKDEAHHFFAAHKGGTSAAGGKAAPPPPPKVVANLRSPAGQSVDEQMSVMADILGLRKEYGEEKQQQLRGSKNRALDAASAPLSLAGSPPPPPPKHRKTGESPGEYSAFQSTLEKKEALEFSAFLEVKASHVGDAGVGGEGIVLNDNLPLYMLCQRSNKHIKQLTLQFSRRAGPT